jgi:hypothetical protein
MRKTVKAHRARIMGDDAVSRRSTNGHATGIHVRRCRHPAGRLTEEVDAEIVIGLSSEQEPPGSRRGRFPAPERVLLEALDFCQHVFGFGLHLEIRKLAGLIVINTHFALNGIEHL